MSAIKNIPESMKEEFDTRLANRLSVLKDQPERNPQKAARGRAAFLAQAEELVSSLPPVSAREKRRHNRWMHAIQTLFVNHRKEHSPMFSVVSTILLIVSLVLGGGGITVAAAQSSQPDQSLYLVKTWSEEVRSGLTANEQARLQLSLAYANRRAGEMQRMLQAGKVPPEAVPTRMQAEYDLALRTTAGQSDKDALKNLEQIRDQLQEHERAFLNLNRPANSQAEAILEQTRSMLHDRLKLCEDGLQDPAVLRERLRDRKHDPEAPSQPGPKPSETGAGNPWTTGTPTPGSSYGPGPGNGNGDVNPWTTGTPTPGSGYGPGPGNGNGDVNPWTTGTPTPGSGYGPGPGDGSGDCSGCGDGNGPGDGSGHDTDSGSGSGSSSGNESGSGSGSGSGSDSGSGDQHDSGSDTGGSGGHSGGEGGRDH